MEKAPLPVQVKMTNHAIRAYVRHYLDTHLEEKLSSSEGVVMGFMFHHQDRALTAQDIMKRFSLSKATVSQFLSGLQKKGLIDCVVSPTDKRCKQILLTPKGEKVHKEFDANFVVITSQLEKGFTEEERSEFERLLKKIRENADPQGLDLEMVDY